MLRTTLCLSIFLSVTPSYSMQQVKNLPSEEYLKIPQQVPFPQWNTLLMYFGRALNLIAPITLDKRLLAAAKEANLTAVQFCLAAGAEVNARDSDDQTVFRYALRHCWKEDFSLTRERLLVIQTLLNAGADITLPDRYNVKPEQLITCEGYMKEYEPILMLIKRQAVSQVKEVLEQHIATRERPISHGLGAAKPIANIIGDYLYFPTN